MDGAKNGGGKCEDKCLLVWGEVDDRGGWEAVLALRGR